MVLSIIDYISRIRQVIDLVFSLALMLVFNNRSNVTLIKTLDVIVCGIIISFIKWDLFDKV
jgi:hypothetical protein